MKHSNKTTYSKEELAVFKTMIHEKIEKTRKLLANLMDVLEAKTNNEPTNTTKIGENSIDVSEQESIANLANRQRTYLDNLEKALNRINDGSYGICKITGRLIDKNRLILVPHTEYSFEAKVIDKRFYHYKTKAK